MLNAAINKLRGLFLNEIQEDYTYMDKETAFVYLQIIEKHNLFELSDVQVNKMFEENYSNIQNSKYEFVKKVLNIDEFRRSLSYELRKISKTNKYTIKFKINWVYL